ncbi:glycoside hydrolase family 25 protein [Streptomyces sp. NPDC015684]|uniref:glycoside hydrolase family 25 protein n=1 Tax=Streptomyces sp. NPDC015684 TaxID=3364963 RepID=UPI0036FB8EA2
MIKGIDVSAYQSTTFDLNGLDFVITKITEGLSYTNPRWVQQRDHAKSKGLVWGAYHYPHMGNSPVEEADHFLEQVKWAPGDLVVLDWEGYDSANKGVSRARQVAYRDAWLAYVKGKMPGHRVGMYCNVDYWRDVDTTSNCGDFLWIATGGAQAGKPGIEYPWTIHQYSTANNIDHDVANFPSRAAMAAWAAGDTEEEPMALTAEDLEKIRKAVWESDKIAAPKDAPDIKTNPTWQAQSYVKDTNARVRALQVAEAGQTAAIAKLAQLIGSNVDTAAVVAAVQQSIAEAVVKVSVDVTGPAAAGKEG